VGLIYSRSGCGKSSLVKAGLLPRLGKHVLRIYLEATPEETEARLLKGVRKVCPELSRGSGLVDSLARLRRGRILAPERKVLLVLDQFASLWNAKPENRHLPSALEWANIRLLTKRRDWSEPQRKMMKRAGRVHGARGVLTFALLSAGVLAGIAVHREVVEIQRATESAGLVQRLLDADTPLVPDIVGAMRDYRQWVVPSLRSELEVSSDDSRQKLHASLALLPVDATQVDYLFQRLIKATPSELPVLRDALSPYRATLTPKLWVLLDSAKPNVTHPRAVRNGTFDEEAAGVRSAVRLGFTPSTNIVGIGFRLARTSN